MNLINRGIVVVRAKRPFWEWIRSIPELYAGGITLDEINEDCTTLLVPEMATEEAAQQYLHTLKPNLFEQQLESWYTDRGRWPNLRNAITFDMWFALDYHSMVWDTTAGPILKGLGEDFPDEGQDYTMNAFCRRIDSSFGAEVERRNGHVEITPMPNLTQAEVAINDYRQLTGDASGTLHLHLYLLNKALEHVTQYELLAVPFASNMQRSIEQATQLLNQYPELYREKSIAKQFKQLRTKVTGMRWLGSDVIRDTLNDIYFTFSDKN